MALSSSSTGSNGHVLLHSLVIAIFALGVLVTAGYGFGINDSANYIPLVWERIDPGLYRGDVMFTEIFQSPWNLHTAFFSSVMAALGKIVPLEWAFLAGHLCSLWVLFFAIWALGCAIGGPVVGYVGLAALAVNRIVGDVVMLIPDEFVPRSAAVSVAFLAIAIAVRWQRFRWSAAAASLAILLHPVSAAMALPVVVAAPLFEETPWRQRAREMAIVLAILAGPFLAWHLLHAGPASAGLQNGLFTLVSAEWQRLIDARMMGQAVNVAPWRAKDWLSIGVPVAFWLLALGRRETLSSADRRLGLGIAAVLAIAAIGCVAADVFRLSLFTQMMLVRVVFLAVVIGTLYGVWWLIEQLRAGDGVERIVALVALASLTLAGSSLSVLTLLLLAFLHVTRRDPGLRLAARGLALSWLTLAVPIATLNFWYPTAASVARPHLLIFGAPPLLPVLLVASLLGGAAWLGRGLGPRRLPALAAMVAMAPLLLYGVTHRHLGPAQMVRELQAGFDAPWQPGNTPWRETAYWARQHTPTGSRFLVPFNEVGFRAMARRPIAGNWKDGGLVLFSAAHAKRWEALSQAISQYSTWSPDRIAAVARSQGCDYVVLPRARALEAPVVFENAEYAVYAVTALVTREPSR